MKKKTAQQRYQYENIRGQIPLPPGWDQREYTNTREIEKNIDPFYAMLGAAGVFDALHEQQTQKSDGKMIFRTNIGNAIGKAKESKQLKTEEEDLPEEIIDVADE